MNEKEFFDAVRSGDAARVAQLLDSDPALANAKAGDITAVLLAVYHGQMEIARLIASRAEQLTFGEAIAIGDAKRVHDMLVADPSLIAHVSGDGFPALGLAIFFRQPDLARLLIEKGADVSFVSRNEQRVAPVHAAASVGDRASMQLLLDGGASPNLVQQQGFVPLHAAAGNGDGDMAELLLQRGADPLAKTDDGKTAADIAAERGHAALAERLRAESSGRS
jgi:ankyrin repeat protein